MTKASTDPPQRFPNLSRLGIAILEHLVGSTIGEAAIEEVKKPYAEKQISNSLGQALAKVEADFIDQHKDQDARDALLQLPIHDLPSVSNAIWEFYKRPNDHTFSDLLVVQLNEVKKLSKEQVDSAVDFYLKLLRRELINIDGELREKIQTLAILDIADAIKELSRKAGSGLTTSPPIIEKATPQIRRKRVQKGSLPAGSYLPFTRNALFTGREEDLKQLEKSLLGKNSSSTLISQRISGMGGIGKTQLAVEFAYRYSHKFKGIHWLDLHDPGTLDSEIAQCGEQMLLQPWSKELPEQVLLTQAAWKADGPRLLILDNFEVPHEGGQVLSKLQAPNLRLLITSRRSDWPAALGIRPLSLEVFTEQESIDFLQKYTQNRFSKEQLQTLAERLGHLPLALELAGRYLEKHPRLAVEGYLSRLEKALDHESMRGFRKDLPSPTQHDVDLLSTFSLSWKEVKDDTAQKLFLVAAYCAPNIPIPLEIFEKTLDLDETACDGGLDVLVGLGLLKENAIIHPLLADYARHLDQENLILSSLTERLAAIANERNAEVDQTGNYSLYSPLLSHVRSVAEKGETTQIPSAGSLWNSLGYHIHALADYAAAKAAYERALKIDEAAFGPDHPKVAIRVNNLGSVLQAQGDLAGAKAAYERALEIDEAAFGPDHPNVARDINNLGSVVNAQGDLAGAKAAYERALKIFKRFLPEGHPNIRTVENNLRALNESKS